MRVCHYLCSSPATVASSSLAVCLSARYIIRPLVHNSAFLTCKNDVGAQAAVSSTPRSPGKTGPAGGTTKRSKHRRRGDAARGHSGRAETGGPRVSVLRRPSERGARDSSHGEPPTLSAWSADTANKNELPSPEAEGELEHDDNQAFAGEIHGSSAGCYEQYGNNRSPPPPSPQPKAPADNDTESAQLDRQQGYHISADVQADRESHYHGKDRPDETAAVIVEADETIAGKSGGGGGKLVQEV